MSSKHKLILKHLTAWYSLTAIIVLVVFVIIWVLGVTQPEAQKRGPKNAPGIAVDTMLIEHQDFRPEILSYGLVEPRTRSRLVAQVTGRVEFMADRFRDGGFFKKGDILLKLESADYEIEVHVAEANLAEAEQALQEEIAESEQAYANWKILGKTSAASSLTLREPQLKAAKARVKSQEALLQQAKLNLARTEIRAPFDGRVLTTDIDLGEVAAANAVLGEIYATDTIEIQLPIKNSELAMLDLPETYSHINEISAQHYPRARFYSELAGTEIWLGNVIRTSGQIDDTSRQLYVFAQIEAPFGEKAEGRFPLKIGQYVTAKIEGRALSSVIAIPNKAIYQGTYVYVYENEAVFRRPIKIRWQDSEQALIESGLSVGEYLVTSPLGQVASGTAARNSAEKKSKRPDKLARDHRAAQSH